MERTWKEALIAKSRYYARTFLKGIEGNQGRTQDPVFLQIFEPGIS
jgi:hypothetical protein